MRLRRNRGPMSWVLLVVGMVATTLFWPAAAAFGGDGVPAALAFSRFSYIAPPDSAYPEPIQVTVTDGAGDPAPGVEVTFSVDPDPVSGASVDLSAASALTDTDGVASVTATSGSAGGFAVVRAQAGTVQGAARMVVRPPGYLPGEQLASVVGYDQDGVQRDIRDTLGKRTFTMVDVCAGWCQPCRQFARNIESARQELADTYHLKLEFTTLLMLGRETVPSGPSSQPDAEYWKATNGLSGSVLHAGGSTDSDVYRASDFFILDDSSPGGAFPTTLLVDPDGTIVDRVVGGSDVSDVVNRVLQAAGRKPHGGSSGTRPEPQPATAQVGVTLDGQSVKQSFRSTDDQVLTDLGLVFYFEDATDPSAVLRFFGLQDMTGLGLPESGSLDLSLNLLGTNRLQTLADTTVPLFLFSSVADESSPDGYAVVRVMTTATATSPAPGTTAVSLDLAQLRTQLRQKLVAGDFDTPQGPMISPTAEQIDQLVQNLSVVGVAATYIP